MRILIDTDVLLDFAVGREPFAHAGKRVIAWAEANPGRASIAWLSLSNLAYLAPTGIRDFLLQLIGFVEIPPTGTSDAVRALNLPMHDLEDALQVAAALAFNATYIVSRNTKDYRLSPVPAITPGEFCAQIGNP
jgi:predicted nucleic acid-binding protein